MTEFHVSRDGTPFGSYSEEIFRQYVADGTILPTDNYWFEGMKEWAPVSGFYSAPLSNTKVRPESKTGLMALLSSPKLIAITLGVCTIAYLANSVDDASNPLIGKWESHGIFRLEFTEKKAFLAGGECDVDGYTQEVTQVDGRKFKMVTFNCVDKGQKTPISVLMINNDTMAAFSDEWHRVR